MATRRQSAAARRNIKKAKVAATAERTIADLPRATREDLARQAAKGRSRRGAAGHALEDRNRSQLYALAREKQIPGRSKTAKWELIDAIPRGSNQTQVGRQMTQLDGLICIVETPKGSRNKYEYDEGLARIRLDRFLAASVVYPTDYGFVQDTLSQDGDTLDALICLSEATFPGCAVEVKPVALLEMEDEDGRDDKIVCVPSGDPAWNDVNDVDDLPQQLRDEISQFFSTYKQLEPGKRSCTGEWRGRSEAIATIEAALERFQPRARTVTKEKDVKAMGAQIEVTHAQATALAELSEREGTLALHQLGGEAQADAGEIYATPRGSAKGYGIMPDGTVNEIGEMLPAP